MTATVLVVDDLETNVKLLEAKLLSEYYTVYTASSGMAALEILDEHKIDIILLDVMMPQMDGFKTCRLIKANPDTTYIPVVMVTALTDVEDRIEGLEAGADEFLTKPVNDIALLARVKSLARMKVILDELRLRNQTNSKLGENIIELEDNFNDSQILIIDEDFIQAKNIIRVLLRLTPHIRLVDHPEDLNALIDSYIPDVIIISCQLDREDPLRIAVNLRAKEQLRYTSFVLMTEEEDMRIVIRGMELGVNDYFHYPVDENELLARIKIQLRRKKYQNSLRKNIEQSISLAVKDALTNIYNRRYFDTHIDYLVQKAKDSCKPLALLMFDLDHFKEVNDNYGHQAGDIVIKEFANAIRNELRITDLFARYGGEEFVAVIYDINYEAIQDVAEKLRSKIEKHEFIISTREQKAIHKTVSIGISFYTSLLSAEDLIEKADKALYQAKAAGRNRVSIAPTSQY